MPPFPSGTCQDGSEAQTRVRTKQHVRKEVIVITTLFLAKLKTVVISRYVHECTTNIFKEEDKIL